MTQVPVDIKIKAKYLDALPVIFEKLTELKKANPDNAIKLIIEIDLDD